MTDWQKIANGHARQLREQAEERERLLKEKDAEIAAIKAARDMMGNKWAEMMSANRALSHAYVRLRAILNAFDTPTAPTPEQIWTHTEERARKIVADRDASIDAELRAHDLRASVEKERDVLRAAVREAHLVVTQSDKDTWDRLYTATSILSKVLNTDERGGA